MTEQPLVSILILNWNGAQVLKLCLDSVFKTTYAPVEIVLVDNGSTDNSLEVAAAFPTVKVVRAGGNLGYSGGNNLGFRHCTGRYIVTLNNDIEVEPDWLLEPVRMFESNPDIGIISCRQMNAFDRTKIDTLYSYLESFLLLTRLGYGKTYDARPAYSSPGYVLGANGASAIYRKEVIERLGGVEESFFAYHEECDLHMRAFYAGWRCVYVPASVVYHRGSYTFDKHRETFFYYHERNRIWFIYRNFPLSLIAGNIHVILLRELRTFINIAVRNRMPLVYLRARIHGFVGMGTFKKIRKANCAKFLEKKALLMRLFKERKLCI
jgi:hypothetical protein